MSGNFSGSTEGRVRLKDRTSLRTPETAIPGDRKLRYLVCLSDSTGLWYLHIKKEENEEKEERVRDKMMGAKYSGFLSKKISGF